MEPTETSRHRKREYVIIRHAQKYYYARANRNKPDQYDIMAAVEEKEGRGIIERANETSDFNRAIDKVYDVADKFMDNWDKDNDEQSGKENDENPS